MPGFDTGSVMYALNVDFTGTSLTSGQATMLANGQLLIGSTSLPNIRIGTITSPLGTLSIGYAAPNITIDVAGGASPVQHLTGDSGGTLSPVANNFNILGRSGSKTSGSGATLTVKSPPYTDQGLSTTVTLNSGSSVTAAITLTLPASVGLADGDLFEFYCTTAGALVIQAVGAQKIRIGTLLSSAAGTATSTAIGDSVSLRFNATLGFFVATSVIGTFVLA